MVGLYIEEEGRDHRDGFLSREISGVGFVNEEVLESDDT